MNPRCGCGSPRTVRHATDRSTHLRLAGGKAVEVHGIATRYLCKGCGRTFTCRPTEAEAEECAVRDKAAELAFALGRAPAARELGIETTTMATLMARWHAARDIEALDAAPDFLLVDRVNVRKKEAFLLTDVDRETLVDIVQGTEGLAGWLGAPGRMPALKVVIPIDAEVAGTFRRTLPGATVMVAPSTVARAIWKALATGLRSLRNDSGMRGRNAMPGTAGFIRTVRGNTPVHDGWPLEVLSLVTAGRAAAAIAAAPDAEHASRIWPEFELAASGPGGGPLSRLMTTWRDAILSGLDHGFVDRFSTAVRQVRRAAQSRRPSIVFQDFRGLVLFGTGDRTSTMPRSSNMQATPHACGRLIAGLAVKLGQTGMVAARMSR